MKLSFLISLIFLYAVPNHTTINNHVVFSNLKSKRLFLTQIEKTHRIDILSEGLLAESHQSIVGGKGILEESNEEGYLPFTYNPYQSDSTKSSKQMFINLSNLIKDIYAMRMNRQSAIRSMKKYHDALKRLFPREINLSTGKVSFPLGGYSPKALIRSKGKGFVGEKHYNFFDGNSHKGHPALDLFIYDRNQDCIDDRTDKPVPIASVTDGVVVCANTFWSVDSCDAHNRILRGGKYVFIYSPHDDALWYYAHLGTINVYAGQKVKSGDVLGTVGRTGANAMMKRSSTHLHLMMLEWKDEGLSPRNPVDFFKTSLTK